MRTVLALICAVLLGGSGPAHSSTLALYDAGSTGSPPDPTTAAGGSWSETLSGAGHSSGPVVNDASLGLDAWNITDASTLAGGTLYTISLTGAENTDATTNGWLLNGRLRMVDGLGPNFAHFLFFDDTNIRWSMVFDLDASGDLVLGLQADVGNSFFTLTSGGTGAAAYHDYEIAYDPVGGLATVRFDGQVLTSSYAGLTTVNISGVVLFGTGSGFGQGSANYNFVSFTTVPEPATFVTTLLGLLALSARKRRI